MAESRRGQFGLPGEQQATLQLSRGAAERYFILPDDRDDVRVLLDLAVAGLSEAFGRLFCGFRPTGSRNPPQRFALIVCVGE